MKVWAETMDKGETYGGVDMGEDGHEWLAVKDWGVSAALLTATVMRILAVQIREDTDGDLDFDGFIDALAKDSAALAKSMESVTMN